MGAAVGQSGVGVITVGPSEHGKKGFRPHEDQRRRRQRMRSLLYIDGLSKANHASKEDEDEDSESVKARVVVAMSEQGPHEDPASQSRTSSRHPSGAWG